MFGRKKQTQPAADSATPEVVVAADSQPEAKTKRSWLSIFKRKPKPVAESVEPKTRSQEAESARERQVRLAQLIDKQVARAHSGDYITIKIRKQTTLILLGLAVLLLWLVPLSRDYWHLVPSPQQVINAVKEWRTQPPVEVEAEPEASESAQPASEPEASQSAQFERQDITVRIKHTPGAAAQADAVRQAFESLEYQVVDVTTEAQAEYAGYSAAVKVNDQELFEQVKQDLTPLYQLASSSATLTEDSNIDVVVLVGE